jgi:methyl-accepting chemotaxis protein
VIVQNNQDAVILSYGILDEENMFTDNVVRITLQSNNPEQDAETIRQMAADLQQEESGATALRKKVLALNTMVADAGLKAEQTRTEILQHVENINAKEQLLAETRQQQRELTVYMGVIAAFANMFILFILVRRIVERPLSTLTTTIDEIQNGNFPEVPDVRRRDQIGVLADAIRKFREALLEIRDETERKAREKILIDETVQTTTTMIDEIESRAKDLVSLAESLQHLAETTGTKADNVARSAEDTAKNTDQVSDSAVQLEEVFNTLQDQVTSQNTLVGDIVEKNRASQIHMAKLGQAVKEIDTIIDLVSDITEQTQLLALNATIEAARAGEAGKGFSVVATEMKELSTKTQQAATEVRHKVEAIGGAGNTLTRNFDEIESYLDNLDHATSTIAEGVASQRSAVTTINELAAKTSTNTHDVSSTIQHVNKTAGETSKLSRRVYEHADEIAAQLSALLHETTENLQQMQEYDKQIPEKKVLRLPEKKLSDMDRQHCLAA